jgi:hypothetical protein
MNEIITVVGSVLTLGFTANKNQVAKVSLSSDDKTDLKLGRFIECRFYVTTPDSKVQSAAVTKGKAYCMDVIVNRKGEPLTDKTGAPMVAIAATKTIKKGQALVYQQDELFVLQAEEISAEQWQDYK